MSNTLAYLRNAGPYAIACSTLRVIGPKKHDRCLARVFREDGNV